VRGDPHGPTADDDPGSTLRLPVTFMVSVASRSPSRTGIVAV